MKKTIFVLLLIAVASSAHALTFPFADQFYNASSWGTAPYTVGGITAPAPTVDMAQNAPGSTGGALRFTLPQGWIPGYEPGLAYSSLPLTEELWMEYSLKYSDNYQYEPVANKHVYWKLGISSAWVGDFVVIVDSEKKIIMGTQPRNGATNALYGSNTSYNPTIERGVWYKIKVHIKLNTSANPYNGIFEAWVNDQKVMTHTNVNFRGPQNLTSKMCDIQLIPVWGGGAGPNNAAQTYVWYDAVRIQATPFEDVGPPDPSVPGAPGTIRVSGGKFRVN